MAARFPLGRIVVTPGASEVLARTEESLQGLLGRHARGDWGDCSPEDRAANDRSMQLGTRVLSSYRLKDGTHLWVITEGNRQVTTVLLPEEY